MGHVLIIEDELLIALDLQACLEDLGFSSIDMAATEAEAVTLAKARLPSLIVSDVRLAQGTGPGAVAQIREALGDIPVIFATGNPDALEAMMANWIVVTKPLAPGALSIAVQKYFSRSTD